MSMDNGFVIRQIDPDVFVLQDYSMSADEYPPLTQYDWRFTTLEDAVQHYASMEAEAFEYGYPLSEYGLSFQLLGR